jgi:hypothetical protein
MRMRAEDLRPHGWQPGRTLHIPAWCGCTTEFVPVPVGDGGWQPEEGAGPGRTPAAPAEVAGGGVNRSYAPLGEFDAREIGLARSLVHCWPLPGRSKVGEAP